MIINNYSSDNSLHAHLQPLSHTHSIYRLQYVWECVSGNEAVHQATNVLVHCTAHIPWHDYTL